MMNQNATNFTCLNRGGEWLGQHWSGLEITAEGSLQLASLPLGNTADSEALAGLPAPDGPAGVAVDGLGTVYFSDPAAGRVLTIDGCDGARHPMPCLGVGCGIADLHTPRGLLWSAVRQCLFIVDSSEDRIQLFDRNRGQVVGIWGGTGSQPGDFKCPWTMAEAGDGSFYVVDYGNARVQKFNAVGDVVPGFWQNLAAAKVLSKPSGVAARGDGPAVRVFILDEAAHAVFVVDGDGNPVRDAGGNPVSFGADRLQQPMGMAAIGSSVFVGDNALRQVLQFDGPPWQFRGAAVGFSGPVAAMCVGPGGTLLVLPGGGAAPVTLQLGQGYGRQGVFWTSAIAVPPGKVRWHRLAAECGALAPDAHLEWFLHTSNSQADAPSPPQIQLDGGNPFTDLKWCARSADVADVFIGGPKADYLWAGAWFSGDGLASPVVSQVRVEFDHETYLASLPAIYRSSSCPPIGGTPSCPPVSRKPPGGEFLLRFLSLLETFNQETEDAIHNLPALFDPCAAAAAYLPWLADWLALDLQEDWDEATVRRAIRAAFASYGRRGTPAGLKAALKQYAGVDAIIEEPLLHASLWALPAPVQDPCGTPPAATPVTWEKTENSVLGYTTMLAPAQAQGAVVGATAVLDQSHLIADSDFGAPLFEDVAFQFSVSVFRGQVSCPAALPLVQSVIEKEKPAHTAYQLCVIEAQMRVGFQARVGIDAVVGGTPTSIRLGDTTGLGTATALGGQPAGRIGAENQLGITTLVR